MAVNVHPASSFAGSSSVVRATKFSTGPSTSSFSETMYMIDLDDHPHVPSSQTQIDAIEFMARIHCPSREVFNQCRDSRAYSVDRVLANSRNLFPELADDASADERVRVADNIQAMILDGVCSVDEPLDIFAAALDALDALIGLAHLDAPYNTAVVRQFIEARRSAASIRDLFAPPCRYHVVARSLFMMRAWAIPAADCLLQEITMNTLLISDGYLEAAKRLHNKLMHALNGNTTHLFSESESSPPPKVLSGEALLAQRGFSPVGEVPGTYYKADVTAGSTTTAPPTVSSWRDWVPAIFQSKPTVGLQPDDRALLTRLTDTVKAFPAAARSELESATSSLKHMGLPSGLQEFVAMLSDVIVMAMIDDTSILLAMQPRMLLQYGVLNTAILDALTWFVKQFTQRLRGPVDQDGADPAPTAEDPMEWSIGALFSVLHYYTIGQLPTSIPKDTLKYLIGLNAGFMLAKNLEHFGVYIVKMVKYCLDAVWRLITGRPWFDQGQNEVVDMMKASLLKVDALVLIKEPNRSQLSEMRLLSIESNKILALAATRDLPREVQEQFKNAHIRLAAHLVVEAGPAQYTDPRIQMIAAHLSGEPGVGKTTLLRAVMSMLIPACGYEGVLSEMVATWQTSANFQPPMPKRPHFMVIDDMFLVQDPQRHGEIISFMTAMGSTVPVMQDNPVAPEKGRDYYTVDYGFGTDNVIPNQLPINTPAAFARRFIGGMHRVELNPEYYQPGTKHFDSSKVVGTPEEILAHLNKAWTLTDHAGVVRDISGFVAMLTYLRTRMIAGQHKLDSIFSSLSSNFVVPDKARVSLPPSSLWSGQGFLKNFKDADALPDIALALVEDQSFKLNAAPAELAKWLRNNAWSDEKNAALVSRAQQYMKASPDDFVCSTVGDQTKLTRNNVALAPKFFHDLFVPDSKPVVHNFNVPVSEWTPLMVDAAQGEVFVVKNACCRHGTYCYRHGNDMCASWDDDAVQTSHVGFSHWALANLDLDPASIAYHRLIFLTQTPVQDHPAVALLKTSLRVLAAGTAGYLIAVLLNKIFTSYYSVRDQSYGSTGARLARKVQDARIAGPQFNAPKPPPANQSNPIGSTDWLVTKCSDAVIPFHVRKGLYVEECSMTRIVGNIAIAPRHVFFDGAQDVVLGGLLAQTLPLRRCDKPEDLISGPFVQIVPDRLLDLAVVVLPTSLLPVNDVSKYLASEETDLSSLTGVALAVRKEMKVELDSERKPFPVLLSPLHAFPIGDVHGAYLYETSAKYQGIYAKATLPTQPAMCGFPVYTTNPRVGRGSRILLGIHVAYQSAGKNQITAPYTIEAHTAFVKRCPPGTLNLVSMQSRPTFLETDRKLSPNILVQGALPPSDRQFQNSKSNIVRSPLYDVLVGTTVYDPVTKRDIVIEAPNVGPAPIRDILPALAKVARINHVPDASHLESYKECVAETKDHVLRFCDPKLIAPQSWLFTLDEAINGHAELGIPGLDMRKSPGYQPPHKPGHAGRHYWATQVGDQWVPNQNLVDAVDEILEGWSKGELNNAFVVNHTKVELRPLLPRDAETPGLEPQVKYARATGAYSFPNICAIRRVAMHIPGIFMTGRNANGMTFGADLNGPDGREAGAARQQYNYVTSGDITNCDASKSSYLSEPTEEMIVDFIRMRFPFLSREAARCPALLTRVCWVVVGDLVYLSWHGLKSGHPFTTTFNCCDVSSLGRKALRDAAPASNFNTDVYSQVYGDDIRVFHNEDAFTTPALIASARPLGVVFTPVSKSKDGTPADFVAGADDVHLKRGSWQDVNGQFHAPLKIDTVNHIHAFYHNRDSDPALAIHQNAEAALREWFHYGRRTFNIVKDKFNAALLAHHIRHVVLDYDALYKEWTNNFGSSPMRHMGKAENQSGFTDLAGAGLGSQTNTAPNRDTTTKSVTNPESTTQTTSDSGIVTQKGLTKHVDNSSVSTTTLTAEVAVSSITNYNPYPPLGVEKIIMREYPIASFEWLAADPDGTAYNVFQFPDDMFAIPTIAEKLASIRYERATITLGVRVNGGQYCGGALQFAYLPDHQRGGVNAWREHFQLLANSENYSVSAAKSDAVRFQLPWASAATWFDLQSSSPSGAIGCVFVHVLAKQEWMSATPPTSLTCTVYACFADVQLAGMNINPAPTRPKIRDRARVVNTNGVANQSAVGDAISKALQGVEVVAGTIGGAVKTAVNAADSLGALGALFDKPVSVATVQRVVQTGADGSHHVDGTVNSQFLSAPSVAYVSNNNKLMSEASPQPKWREILCIPGMIGRFTWAAQDVGDKVWDTVVNPTVCYELNTDLNFIPTPMAYYAMRHRFWSGSIKMLIRLFNPTVQKGQLRVTYIPSTTASTGVSDDVVGDLETATYDITGDHDIALTLRNNAITPTLNVIPPTGVSIGRQNTPGRVVVQVVHKLSSQLTGSLAPVSGVVYFAAGEDFVLSGPCALPEDWFMDYVPSTPVGKEVNTMFGSKVTRGPPGRIVNQACVRDLFGTPFPPLSQSKAIVVSGTHNPDQTDGVVSLNKRFVMGKATEAMPYVLVPGLFYTDDVAWVYDLVPFKHWSGSINYMVRESTLIASTGGAIFVQDNIPSQLYPGTQGFCAYMEMRLARESQLTFTVPFNTNAPACQIHNEDGINTFASYTIDKAAGTVNDFSLWRSLGDDFSLYHFVACPFLINSAAQGQRRPKLRKDQQLALAEKEKSRRSGEQPS